MHPHESGISEFFLNTDSSQTGRRLDNGLLFSHRTLDIPKKSAFQLLISREFECPTTHSRRSTAGSKGLPTHANERPPGSVSQYPSPPLPGVLTICHLGGTSFDRAVVALMGLCDAGAARQAVIQSPPVPPRWMPMCLCHDVAGSDHPWRNRPFKLGSIRSASAVAQMLDASSTPTGMSVNPAVALRIAATYFLMTAACSNAAASRRRVSVLS